MFSGPAEGNTEGVAFARRPPTPRRRRPWHAHKPFAREPGGLHHYPRRPVPGARRAGRGPEAMSVVEKSDSPKVARKQANKAATAAAELVERRGGAKEKAELQSTDRTQSREAVSQAQARIREAVTRNGQDKLTALLHHIGVDALRASFSGLKKSAAPGVDDVTWTEYAENLEANLADLHRRVHTGAYRA